MRKHLFRPVAFATLFVPLAANMEAGKLSGASQNAPSVLRFEAASVKPSLPDERVSIGCHGADGGFNGVPIGRCVFRHANLRQIIMQAYPSTATTALRIDERIVGAPGWIDEATFDIEAKTEDEASTTLAQLRQMLQAFLNERFALAFHMENKQFSGYYMVVAKDGFKLKESTAPLSREDAVAASRRAGRGAFIANNMTLADFASLLSIQVKAPIIDKTGIPGKYNIVLMSAETSRDDTAPSIFTAVQEQLGLKLESAKIPFEIFIIDHAEKPSQNDPER